MKDTIKTSDVISKSQPATKPHTRAGKNTSIRINVVCAELKTLLHNARMGNPELAIEFVNKTSKVGTDMAFILGRKLTESEKVSLLDCAEFHGDVEFSVALSIAKIWQVERQLARIILRSMRIYDNADIHNYGTDYYNAIDVIMGRFIADAELFAVDEFEEGAFLA